MRPFAALIYICAYLLCCHIGPLLRHSKSVGLSAPIAYATSVSPPNEAIAWLGAQVVIRWVVRLSHGRGAGVGRWMRLLADWGAGRQRFSSPMPITSLPSASHSLFEHKKVLRQISCCQVKQVWKILIQRSRSEARPYILLLIYFILLFRPSISPLLIEYFMAFLMGEMSRWTLFTKLTTSP